jgi:outer membrane protein
MKLFNVISAALLAASCAAPTASAQDGPPQGWGLGVGVVVSSAIYVGEDRRITPVPLLTYESKRLFWRGIGGGAHLLRRNGFSLDATLSLRMDGMDRDDFGTVELAQRGVDRALLEDRDNGLDLGLAAGWSGDLGKLELGVKTDISGASKGYEGTLKYGYPIRMRGTRITPHVGVSIMSKKLANYYYGTLDAEVARGVVDYKPGGATVPSIGIDIVHPLSGKWVMLGGLTYKALPSKITDSPLLKKDANGGASLMLGVSRGF